MALIKCQECGNMVSTRATACPKCGCPVAAETNYEPQSNYDYHEEEKGSKKSWLYAIIGLLTLIIIGMGFYLSSNHRNDKATKNDMNDTISEKVEQVQTVEQPVSTETADPTVDEPHVVEEDIDMEDYEEDHDVGTRSDYAWGVNSPSQLENKIKGTVWTCRPTSGMWYRLDFKGDKMYLSYAVPSMGKWSGYLDNQNEHDIYAYRIQERHTSDTGEKYLSIQFHHLDNDVLAIGALNFFKSGDVELSMLRGKYGGPAECKDFNWE